MNAALEVKDLYYHYPDGTEALRLVNFAVAPGECVGLIGPNGAGKSTLLRHLNGLLPDDAHARGNIYVDGEKVCKENLAAIRRKVGLLFQDPDDQLFCSTVAEDVAFGPKQFGFTPQRVAEVVADSLAKVGLSGFEKRAPHRLSGGEKRRVCFAGVLACEPSVLVLDEPTSNLDPRGRRELKALLRQIPATRIIATHDLELVVELCSRAILIDRGQVIVQGSPLEVLGNEPLMFAHGLERPHSLMHRHPHGPVGSIGDSADCCEALQPALTASPVASV